MSRQRPDIFCSICGEYFKGLPLPAHDSEEPENVAPTQWAREAALLSDPANEFDLLEVHYRAGKYKNYVPLPIKLDVEDVEIKIEPAVFVERNIFQLTTPAGDGAAVESNEQVGHDEHGNWINNYRIAVHASCLRVAQAFLAAQKKSPATSGTRITSMRSLWKALRMRWEALNAMLMRSAGFMSTSSAYPLLRLWGVYDKQLYFVQDPICPSFFRNPTTTATSIVRMAPVRTIGMPDKDGWRTSFKSRFNALPQELRDMIISQLARNLNLGVNCNRLISNDVWREMVIGGHVLQVIGPLDRDALICAEQKRLNVEREQDSVLRTLDWEKLVRWLTQNSLQPWTNMEGGDYEGWVDFRSTVPDELWYRKAVWRLMQNMYVCDVLPRYEPWMIYEAEPVAVPRYWDEAGQRVYPIVRLSGDEAIESL